MTQVQHKTMSDSLYDQEDFRRLIDVSDVVFENIIRYHALLLKWNKAINIVSPKTLNQAWHRHLIDSAQVSQYVPTKTEVYADLGCGGGFPGLVIAMMRPDLQTHLVESDERKGQFMRSVVRETALKNVTIHTKRIEDAHADLTPDFVTARALASLEQLFDYCLPWVESNPDLCFGFMKGMRSVEEVEAAKLRYDFTVRSHESITDSSAQILIVEKLRTIV